MAKGINWLWKTIDSPSDTSDTSSDEGDDGVTLSELSEQYRRLGQILLDKYYYERNKHNKTIKINIQI